MTRGAATGYDHFRHRRPRFSTTTTSSTFVGVGFGERYTPGRGGRTGDEVEVEIGRPVFPGERRSHRDGGEVENGGGDLELRLRGRPSSS